MYSHVKNNFMVEGQFSTLKFKIKL